VKAHGIASPFLITAVVLAAYGVLTLLVMRDAPGRQAPTASLVQRLGGVMRLSLTWQASALYALVFGGYVAFSVYLPTYLKTAYGLTQADAANRMAGFVLFAVVMRPIGGYLSDRFAASRVLTVLLVVVAAGAAVQALTPSLAPVGTVAFLAMAAALGTGSGAAFALVAQRAPAGTVGSVTGIVGAAGGLGGFVPPLILGSLYGHYANYGIGLALLAAVAVAAVIFTVRVVARPVPAV
ncbi:MAG TPA: MFS transporter, partial [Kineosporiaceae bacterium]|nr:MFS transporter [Kineosporiaceae bacterium]